MFQNLTLHCDFVLHKEGTVMHCLVIWIYVAAMRGGTDDG